MVLRNYQTVCNRKDEYFVVWSRSNLQLDLGGVSWCLLHRMTVEIKTDSMFPASLGLKTTNKSAYAKLEFWKKTQFWLRLSAGHQFEFLSTGDKCIKDCEKNLFTKLLSNAWKLTDGNVYLKNALAMSIEMLEIGSPCWLFCAGEL